MTSATTQKPAKQSAPSATDESLRLFAEADQMLLDFVRRGGTSYGELSGGELLLCRRMAWDRDDIRRQIAFRESIVRHQEVAGSSADRQAAQQRLDAASRALSTEGSKLRTELEEVTQKLNAQINALETEASAAANVVNEISQAVASLRGLAPAHVRHDAAKFIAAAREQISKRVSELDREISRIEGIVKLDFHNVGTRRNIADFCKLYAPHCLTGESEKPRFHPRLILGSVPAVAQSCWEKYVVAQQERLPTLRAELRSARATESSAVREAEEASLSFYIPE